MMTKRTSKILLTTTLVVSTFFSGFSFAETEEQPVVTDSGATSVASAEAIRLQRFRQAARAKLLSKLKDEKGNSNAIFVLSPTDYTTLQSPKFITSVIKDAVTAYDNGIDVREDTYALTSITLEQLRLAMANLKAEIIIVPVIYPTNIDLYLYDKRTPFQIYAHSEPISGTGQYELTRDVAQNYTKLLVRRALYRYIKNQFYELPRDNIPPVLQTEVPRFIASYQSVAMVNREARSDFYGALNWGAAISLGPTDQYWNSNVFSVQLGYQVMPKVYIEGALEMFAYNAVVGSGKYLFTNQDQPFKLSAGLGVALVTNRHTLDWDQTDSLGGNSNFVVPSVSIMIPIVDVYLKAESRLYVGLNGNKYIFTIMPGLFVMF